jgi:multisubunit Na+/H+ antiporter MnhB subunit
VLVAVTTTILMFFVSYSYLKNQEIEFEAINAALAIAALAFPLLTTILLRRSSPER